MVIAILIIAIACCVLYISKLNAKVEKLESNKENVINSEINTDNKEDVINSNNKEDDKLGEQETKKQYIKIYNVGNDFNQLSDVGKLVWSAEKDKEVECDLNNDGIKEKISVVNLQKQVKLIVNDNAVNEKDCYIENLYVVDLNTNDQTTELIGVRSGDSGFRYIFIYSYGNNGLKFVKRLELKPTDELYINTKGDVVNQSNNFCSVYLTKKYFRYYNGYLSEVNVNVEDISNQVFIVKKGNEPMYTYNKDVDEVCQDAMNSNYNLEECGIYNFKEDTKIQIIDFNTEFGNVMKAKLQNGKTIYIFSSSGHLVG